MKRQRSDSFTVAALLALSGGLLDAYTYLCRGGVFANAQTGNLVLLGVRLAEGQWRLASHYLVPILAFVLGVLAAEWLKNHCPVNGRLHWRQVVLGLEILLLAAVSWVPIGPWDGGVNSLVSFVCALQVEAFRTVRGNPFASTMCTGNLRSGTEALYVGISAGDRDHLGRSGCYFGVIACFVAGAAAGVAVSHLAPQRAVLAAAGLQLAALLWMCRGKEGE
ncbi:MAG: YoaK family protein [Oscillibacter sp.]